MFDYGYWAEQAGGEKRRIGFVGVDDCEGELGGVGLLVADEAVDPGVGGFDDDGVLAGL